MNRSRKGSAGLRHGVFRTAGSRRAGGRRSVLSMNLDPGIWGGPGLETQVKSPSAPNPRVPMNLIFGARHLCRFTVGCRQDFGRRSGMNAALRFRDSRRENGFRGILAPALPVEGRRGPPTRPTTPSGVSQEAEVRPGGSCRQKWGTSGLRRRFFAAPLQSKKV